MADSQQFHLLRYFSVTSFFLILAIGTGIIYISRQMLIEQLVESGESANVALANSIANAMWDEHAPYVMSVKEVDGDKLRSKPETGLIHQDVEVLVRNIRVLKVKIYNTDAVTIYSSEMAQIGESKANNTGFLTSLRGRIPASKLSRRGSFSAFSGQVSDVALVETYVPILNRQSNQLESVFELYSDVSALTDRIDQTILKLSYILVGLLLLLYLSLFYVIRQANKTIDHQRSELDKHQRLLESTNDAILKEIEVRKQAEKELALTRQEPNDSRLLPLVKQICQNIANVYLKVVGKDRVDEVKIAYNNWRKNKFLGPSSVNIFITMLSDNLEGQQRLDFESQAQDCIRL